MILRYESYFTSDDIIDHEPLIESIPDKDKRVVSIEKFLDLYCGDYTNIMKEFIIEKGLSKLTLVKDLSQLNVFAIQFFFTENEYNRIMEKDPAFGALLFSIEDRLALTDTGVLYDIDENSDERFKWWAHEIKAEV